MNVRWRVGIYFSSILSFLSGKIKDSPALSATKQNKFAGKVSNNKIEGTLILKLGQKVLDQKICQKI